MFTISLPNVLFPLTISSSFSPASHPASLRRRAEVDTRAEVAERCLAAISIGMNVVVVSITATTTCGEPVVTLV